MNIPKTKVDILFIKLITKTDWENKSLKFDVLVELFSNEIISPESIFFLFHKYKFIKSWDENIRYIQSQLSIGLNISMNHIIFTINKEIADDILRTINKPKIKTSINHSNNQLKLF